MNARDDFNASSAIAGLSKLSDALKDEVDSAVELETRRVHGEAVARAPVGSPPRTGNYRSAIRWKIFRDAPGAVTGKVFVIQGLWRRDLEDKKRAGRPRKWPAVLPAWLEYGTVRSSARPHLIPAFEAGKQRLNAAVQRVLEKAARA